MDVTLPSLLEAFLLVAAVSLDSFVASFAYGTNKIKIPPLSVAVISVICSGMLAVSLFFGSLLRDYVPEAVTKGKCFTILFLLGVVKLFDSAIKMRIRKHKIDRQMKFSFLSLQVILNVYADPEKADIDRSKVLSPLEAVSVAVALSLDGLAVGFGAGLASIDFFQAVVICLLFSAVTVGIGSLLGRKLAEKTNLNLTWVGGVLLLVLAFLKL